MNYRLATLLHSMMLIIAGLHAGNETMCAITYLKYEILSVGSVDNWENVRECWMMYEDMRGCVRIWDEVEGHSDVTGCGRT